MTGRELAWRVFVNELNSSTAEEKGNGEKAPSYLLSPLGARMNRVVLAGTVDFPERSGSGPAGGFSRARLTDSTGTVAVTAGSYQPQGRADLEQLGAPTRAFVVGKVNLYRGAGSALTPSVRAETVHPVSGLEYQSLAAETGIQTLGRLELVLRMRSAARPSDAELTRAGMPPAWIRGARTSLERYPSLDPAPYYEALRAVLVSLRAAPASEPPSSNPDTEAGAPPSVVRVVRPRPGPATPPAPSGFRALEGRLLELVDELANESPDGYADMDELAERAARHGIEGERMEELLNSLSENGTLEEPLVGKFRRAEGPPPE